VLRISTINKQTNSSGLIEELLPIVTSQVFQNFEDEPTTVCALDLSNSAAWFIRATQNIPNTSSDGLAMVVNHILAEHLDTR